MLGPALHAGSRNVASMLQSTQRQMELAPAVCQKSSTGVFASIPWIEFVDRIGTIARFLDVNNIRRGSRVAIWCGNSAERLVAELAVIASGRVSVPIFPGYSPDFVRQLIEFAEVDMLVVDTVARAESLPSRVLPRLVLNLQSVDSFWAGDALQSRSAIDRAAREVKPSDLAVIMFTSGTSSFPKGVMLTHDNIMSQQAALKQLWNPKPGMRFLSYLPWHHSFGGLFERFFALANGGCIAIDDSVGKNMDLMLENMRLVKPHVFFSVPKVYAELVSRVLTSNEAEQSLFHDELVFVFTAAAPLPINVSAIFQKKGVPVIEGWGLTETSPCCTLTEMSIDRKPGVVGRPIPGVEVRVVDDGEIWVRGRNVMQGYYKRPDATNAAFDDGWFKTGDVGEVMPLGLKIVSRKDRIFKLGNGEKIFPTPLEDSIAATCRYVKHVYIFGSGQDAPLALLFPNNELMNSRQLTKADAHCDRPSDVKTLSSCLVHCMDCVNQQHPTKFARISRALMIDQELTVDRQELTPSFKLIPRNIEARFDRYMKCLASGQVFNLPPDAELIDLKEHSNGSPIPTAEE